MTYRPSDSSSKPCYSQPQSRLNQQIRCESTDEGCPVIQESGTVCGETNTLSIFQEFRKIYDDCLKKLEGSADGDGTLKRLAPFRNLIEDLWEQNAMLVETVEALEHEATCTVTNLQEKLNKSCQKMREYEEDVKSLIAVVRRFCENGMLDTSGLKFNTFPMSNLCAECNNSYTTTNCSECDEIDMALLSSGSKNASSAGLKSKKRSSRKKSTSSSRAFSNKQFCSSEISNLCPPDKMNLSKPCSIDSTPDMMEKKLCIDSDSENNCQCCNQNHELDDYSCEEIYLKSPGRININFNLGSDGVNDPNSCYRCECPCKSSSCGCDQ